MKILALRMLGLGDVASIGIPAARHLRRRYPAAELSFLTFGAGAELMELVEEVDQVIRVGPEQWPGDFWAGVRSFARLGGELGARRFDLVVNLDTWFLPCFLAQVFRDAGVAFEGNHLAWSVRETLQAVRAGALGAKEIEHSQGYLASTYPAMGDWTGPWWLSDPKAGPYPRYYLRHCCGFEGEVPTGLQLSSPEDWAEGDALRAEAGGRPIVALAPSSRTKTRQYRGGERLRSRLEEAGCHVWTGFDGSIPMRATLARLAATDLLISVASAPQWLARLVGCPVLMIPGSVPPAVLGAEFTIEGHLACQFCMQRECVEKLDFACMEIPPEEIAQKAAEALRVLGDQSEPGRTDGPSRAVELNAARWPPPAWGIPGRA